MPSLERRFYSVDPTSIRNQDFTDLLLFFFRKGVFTWAAHLHVETPTSLEYAYAVSAVLVVVVVVGVGALAREAEAAVATA
jgi:hypothetical protein